MLARCGFEHHTIELFESTLRQLTVSTMSAGPYDTVRLVGKSIHVFLGCAGISGESARVEGNSLALRAVRLVHNDSLREGHLSCALPDLHGRPTGDVRDIEYNCRPNFWRRLNSLHRTSAQARPTNNMSPSGLMRIEVERSPIPLLLGCCLHPGDCHELESPNHDVFGNSNRALAARIVRSETHE